MLADEFTLKEQQGPLDWSDRVDLEGKIAVPNLSLAQYLNTYNFEW